MFNFQYGTICDFLVVMKFMLKIDGEHEVLLFTSAIQFLWATARLLVTGVRIAYLVDESFSVLLV